MTKTSDILLNRYEIEMMAFVNTYRVESDLEPVVLNGALQNCATVMAEDQGVRWDAGQGLSHIDSQGRDPWTRWAALGYGREINAWKGENLEAGYSTAELGFEGWKASPPHNAVMLGKEYRFAGISMMVSPKGTPIVCLAMASLPSNTYGPQNPNAKPILSMPEPVTAGPK